MFILPEGGKYYGLHECICAMVKCFELCEMGTKCCCKQSFICKSGCNAYKAEMSSMPEGPVMICET
jgi:hypothetical protein